MNYISLNPHLEDLGRPVMQEREARLLLESRDLKTVVVEPSSENSGWLIRIIDKNDKNQFLVSKRSTDPRVFKTSDAALRCCVRIGFNQVEVRV